MINLDWTNDYIDINGEDYKCLEEKIKKAGINIEKVITNSNPLLVMGKITECLPHPDSDHLHICKVDINSEVLQIICGASNAREGIYVIVAKLGCKLPLGEIKKTTIRSVESFGMLCSLEEIGLEEKSEGIYECEYAPLGENALKYLNKEYTIYELDVHKHRNNDCYSHIGFAYEIGAVIDKKVTIPASNYTPNKKSIKDYKSLEVKTTKCPYYLAKMVQNVKIGKSPEFIKNRLNSLGIRSINNVVDISNYVMLEFGCPLHFFDSDKIKNKVIVRDASSEEITTLDGVKRILNKDDIVICDEEKTLCIAGVMGGEDSAITDNTTSIFIESAIFDGISIRNTANRLNLRTEASIRFGKGLNYEYVSLAMNRACELLEKYASAEVLSDHLLHDNTSKENKTIAFKAEDISKILGININDESIKDELRKLDFEYELNDDKFLVTIPKRRLDIDENINDLAEEIGRLYGYDNLVSTLPIAETKQGVYLNDVKYQKIISMRLRALGFNESKSYTLVSPKLNDLINYENKSPVILPNPMSTDKSVVRLSLIPSLLEVYDYNKSHNIQDIFLYEISKTYDKELNEDIKLCILMKGNYITNNIKSIKITSDYYLAKGVLENILDYMGLGNRYTYKQDDTIKGMHPFITSKIYLDKEPIGIIGMIDPSIKKDEIYIIEISIKALIKDIKKIKYKEPSKYPSIVKDVAFIVDNNINSKEIENIITSNSPRTLKNIEVFDIYTGDNIPKGKKSIAYSLTFNSDKETLTEEEVMTIFNNIITSVTTKLNCSLRSM